MNFKKIMISIISFFAWEANAINVSTYFVQKDEAAFGLFVDQSVYEEKDRSLQLGMAANLRSALDSSGQESSRYQGIPYINIEKSIAPGMKYSNKFGLGVDLGEKRNYGFYYMSSSIKIDYEQKLTGYSTFGVELNINDNRFENEHYKVSRYSVSPFIGFGF